MSFSSLIWAFIVPSRAFSVTFDASQRVSPLNQSQLSGTCLPVWNSPTIYSKIKSGLTLSRYATMRFPNGTISNEYHWNSFGLLDSTGIWHPDTTLDSAGFRSTNRYCGTTSSNWGTERYSFVTDGDTTTLWWSDPSIVENDPYIYLSWPVKTQVDSVIILWGDRYSKSFEVQSWEGSISYPGPHQMKDSRWNTIYSDTAGIGGHTSIKCTTTVSTYALRVISHKGFDGSDIQIREIYGFANGSLVTIHKPDNTQQTKTIALSTHPGIMDKSGYQWTFEKFMAYLDTLGYSTLPVISVNYGTGTAEEAAAWVYYANKVKKYNIKYWQIGNEMDGLWEIGGPVNAFTYTEKFLKYSKAMKAVDPSIKILGPLASGLDALSGEHDNRTWLESTIYKIGEAEKRDTLKYLDGIDFHCYPYWTSGTIKSQDMALASDYVYDRSDSMLAWINRYLYTPESTLVMMSEFNASTIMNSVLKQTVNGIINANMNAGLAYKFGYRAMSVIWDSYEGGSVGNDGTHGSLSLFNNTTKLTGSSAYAPSSAFWGNFMVTNVWLDPQKQNFLLKSDTTRVGYLRYYGSATSNDSRVLILNLSTTDTFDVNVSMTGIPYSKVELYSWSEREFFMNGTSSGAYAIPNCGPSSTVKLVTELGTPRIAPKSAIVLRYFDSDSSQSKLQRLFRTCENARPSVGDTIKVAVSYRAVNGIIQSISYRLDSAAYQNVSALDGIFDGSYENSCFTLDSRTLGAGNIRLITRVIASNGDSCFDTLALTGYTSVLNNENALYVKNRLTVAPFSAGEIRITYVPVQNGLARISIYNLSGVLLKELSYPAITNKPFITKWNGRAGNTSKVSSGIYLIKAGIDGSKEKIGQMFKIVN
jgi:hypothetical protein